VQRIAEAATPGILIIDEAYVPFVEEPWDATALLEMGNVVLLRSMTKDHALAGVRLGYALGSAKVLDSLKIYQPFWSVNTVAQAAGLAAIADRRHVAQAKKIVTEARAYLHTALEEMGAHALPASANFLLVKVGNARSIRTALLKRGICVRDCTSFGLPQYIRIAVRTVPECQKLITNLQEVYRD
jgi:histidinol-phosphate aminotransferase